jgi:hypothetical protein
MIIKPMTQTVYKERRDFINFTRNVNSHTILNEGKFLFYYEHTISKEFCQ